MFLSKNIKIFVTFHYIAQLKANILQNPLSFQKTSPAWQLNVKGSAPIA